MAKLLYVCFLSLQPKERQVNGCLHVLCLVKNKFIVKIEGHPWRFSGDAGAFGFEISIPYKENVLF